MLDRHLDHLVELTDLATAKAYSYQSEERRSTLRKSLELAFYIGQLQGPIGPLPSLTAELSPSDVTELGQAMLEDIAAPNGGLTYTDLSPARDNLMTPRLTEEEVGF